MAISPKMAYTILTRVTKKKNLKIILISILTPVGVVIFILTVIISILFAPINAFLEFLNPDDITALSSFRDKFLKPPLVLNGRYPMPVDGNITSEYGYRNDPFGRPTAEFHRGLDIQPKHHSPIISIADGEVIKANTNISSYGNYVMIKHELVEETFYTLSAHLSQVLVRVGQKVVVGDVIGLEGGEPNKDPNPGSSTGHHLHFEVRTTPNKDSSVDPTLYIFDKEENNK